MPAQLRHWDLHVWLWKDNPNGMFEPHQLGGEVPKDGVRLFVHGEGAQDRQAVESPVFDFGVGLAGISMRHGEPQL